MGMVLGGVIQQPGQVTAQDLHLRSGSVAFNLVRCEARSFLAILLNPDRAFLAGPLVEYRLLEPHLAQHFASYAADVDILAAVAKFLGAFQDGDIEAMAAQHASSNIPRNAGASDQNPSAHLILLRQEKLPGGQLVPVSTLNQVAGARIIGPSERPASPFRHRTMRLAATIRPPSRHVGHGLPVRRTGPPEQLDQSSIGPGLPCSTT